MCAIVTPEQTATGPSVDRCRWGEGEEGRDGEECSLQEML